METKRPVFNRPQWEAVIDQASQKNALAYAIASSYNPLPNGKTLSQLRKALTEKLGKDPFKIEKLDDFFTPEFENAIAFLTDDQYARDFRGVLELATRGQYSADAFFGSDYNESLSRCYRSRKFRYYAQIVLRMCGFYVREYYYPGTVKEQFFLDRDRKSPGFKYRVALELQKNDSETFALVHDAIYGENTKNVLTQEILEAIVISGNEELIDDLLKLLSAAKLQEGLRRQILLSADQGSMKTLSKFLKFCVDEKMFRFSGVVGAFNAWTGLDAESSHCPQLAKIAYEVLTDENKFRQYLQSEDAFELYFAFWGTCCREASNGERLIEEFVAAPQRNKRLLGWELAQRLLDEQGCLALVLPRLDERDKETLAAMTSCLPYFFFWRRTNVQTKDVVEINPEIDKLYGGDPGYLEKRFATFKRFQEILLYLGVKELSFSGAPFPWSEIESSAESVVQNMIMLAGRNMDARFAQEFVDVIKYIPSDCKSDLIDFLPEQTPSDEHVQLLLLLLSDRDQKVKKKVSNLLSKYELSSKNALKLADALKSKSGSLRQAIVSTLAVQSKETLSPVVSRLLAAKDENKQQAGIELLLGFKDKDPAFIEEHRAKLEALNNGSQSSQTNVLLKQILAEQEDAAPAKANGFGLYDPDAVAEYNAALGGADSDQNAKEKSAAEIETADAESAATSSEIESKAIVGCDALTAEEYKAAIVSSEELDRLFTRLEAIFTEHADYEYRPYTSPEKIRLGDAVKAEHIVPASSVCRTLFDEGARLDLTPFWNEFADVFSEYLTDERKYVGLYYAASLAEKKTYDLGTPQPWYEEFQKKELASSNEEICSKYKRQNIFTYLARALFKRCDPHRLYVEAVKLYRSLIALIGESNLFKKRSEDAPGSAFGVNLNALKVWRTLIGSLSLSDDDFADWFALEYRVELPSPKKVDQGLTANAFFRACDLGVINRGVLLDRLMSGNDLKSSTLVSLTCAKRSPEAQELLLKYGWVREIVADFVDRVVDVEIKRGEQPTEVTSICQGIDRVEGARRFCQLLAALGKEKFYRGAFSNSTKQAVLSRLLRHCYPAKEDSAESLANELKSYKIKEERLVETAMFASQWAGTIEEVVGWKGLKSGVCFFHAHIGEEFSVEKESEIAIFSAVKPEQFNAGVFDKNWFFDAYEQLGEKRFQTLYRAAQYIGGSLHKRARLYTDAALGKLDAEELRAEIADKRNQDKLRAYSLIPIKPGDEQETLRRYEFIQRFLKESKQFGAQRRATEAQACACAMNNLAMSAGYSDPDRMKWRLEGIKSGNLQALLEPKTIGEYLVQLTIDEFGNAALIVEKGGVKLKGVPKALGKDQSVLELVQAELDIKEQKRRAIESMERAMTERSEFEAGELTILMNSPVLKPIVSKLLWTADGSFGLLRLDESNPAKIYLADADGNLAAVEKNMRPAHPHDLRTARVWAQWTRYFYDQKIVQPFKQVFREYYPLTKDEENAQTISRRYEGYQVNPKRALALLKSRGWTLDYYDGLQKVFYQENLVAELSSNVNWLLPADMEPPTLDKVEFFDRKTGYHVSFRDISPILFSEVMRDLDLAVSVAHVGGVDPEASASTVEMRVAIAEELARLLKLENVSWVGAQARIVGKLANYSVHMGSGVVHAEGIGSINIVAVPSQTRGRIFLPFADDDPKTAEIMAKIVLFAEDGKIKDPAILEQLRN